MNTKAEIGALGESEAAKFLVDKGYTIKERNYRYKRLEIDLIAVQNKLLVFVEVKTKTGIGFGHPEIAVDEKKSTKITEGAQGYIDEIGWQHNVRFDVISVLIKGDVISIEHFEDAFY